MDWIRKILFILLSRPGKMFKIPFEGSKRSFQTSSLIGSILIYQKNRNNAQTDRFFDEYLKIYKIVTVRRES